MIKKISIGIIKVFVALISLPILTYFSVWFFRGYYAYYSWQFPSWGNEDYAAISASSILVFLAVILLLSKNYFPEENPEKDFISYCDRCKCKIHKEEESLHREKKGDNGFWDICEDCIHKVNFQ